MSTKTKKATRSKDKKLRAAVRKLLDIYLMNEGRPDDEFISCVTDVNPRHGGGYWKAWDNVRKELEGR